ncbi:MAG: tetratricopeptide repeat protein [Bryobacteraceae bacterium]
MLATLTLLAMDDLVAVSSRAKAALLAGRYDEAIGAYQQLAKALPQESGPRLNLAVALDAAGRHREALTNLEAIRTAQAANPGFWYLLGIQYQKLQQPAKAVEPLERACKLQPNEQFRFELADAYLASGAYEKARTEFERITRERPDSAKSLQGLALSLLAISREAHRNGGDPGRASSRLAEKALDRLAALPPSAEVHELLARALEDAGRNEEAVTQLRDALRMAPGENRLRGLLAGALWHGRHYDEAASTFAELVKAEPDRADWQYQFGDCLFNLGKVEEAVPHLQKAVEINPGLLTAQAVLGRTLMQLGNDKAALPHLEKALPLDTDGAIHYQLARVYGNLGKTEEARLAMARHLELQEKAKSKQ